VTLALDLDHSDDSSARLAIRDELDRSLFVEAGAGTGKTTVLVDRVVELVARGRVSAIGRLVAITFTEAAAAELRDRIRRGLSRAAASDADPARRRRCDDAVSRIDDAVITTIHGFAHRILAEHPLEARLPPLFEVDDEVRSAVSFRHRWQRFLDELFDDETVAADIERAVTLGLTTAQLHEIALALHDRWDRLRGVSFDRIADPVVDLESVRRPLRTACAELAAREAFDDLLVGQLRQAAGILELLESEGDDLAGLAALAADDIPRRSVGRAPVWGAAKEIVLSNLAEAEHARVALVTGARAAVLERLLGRLAAFTLTGADARRRSGRLEFHDLLVLARDLLRADETVREALRDRIDVVLIDEFQDTDPIQLEIALLLTARRPPDAGDDVDGWDLTEGRLLVVGDPKQSIYRFRGADVTLWDRTRRRFPEGVVHLTRNFRSVPQIVDWVNAVFDRLIGEGIEGAQPRYVPLAATRTRLSDQPSVVLVGEPIDATAGEIRAREAADLARLVAVMRSDRWQVRERSPGGDPEACRPLRFADIALLVPTRTPLGAIERALDDAGIPYRVESRSLVWGTEAVGELIEVLAAVDDPADEVAVVTALRAPGFACTDDALVDYRLAGGRWDYRRPPPTDMAADHPVVEAMAALMALHDGRHSLPVNRLVETVVRERRLIELAMAQRRPRDYWRRLRFVLDQARAFVEAGGQSLTDFVAWARQQADEGAQAIETVVPEPDDDAVRILTVHGSKGLEFPVVVLAGLQAGGDTQTAAVLWGPDRPEVARGSWPRGTRFETAGWADLAGASRDADDLEARRLLYVAATRAQDHLVVSLNHKVVASGRGSYAQRLYRESATLEGLWRPANFPDQLVLDVDGESWRAPPVLPTPDERARWITARQGLLAATATSGAVTATGMAAEAHEGGMGEHVLPGRDGEPARATPPGRGGTAIGRAVHGVLQLVDLSSGFDDPADLGALVPLAATQAAAEGVGESVGDIARMAASALAAPTVLAARRAPRRWREVYVAAPVGRRLVEGYVDLLFDDGTEGLVVVDYKTDALAGAADYDAASTRYRLQAATYALAVESAVGRPVRRCVFVFCRSPVAVERSLEGTELAAAVDEVRAAVGR
jgi:ATP-dependent helicase/nuclease subunit A